MNCNMKAQKTWPAWPVGLTLLQLLILLGSSSSRWLVNAEDEGPWMVNGVDVYVHKSVTPFNSYINLPGGGMLALHLGAEYYVHAPRTSQYTKATGTILLPGRETPGLNPSPTFYTNGTARIPCYIFPILDNVSGKSVDMGIEYVAGKGWFAFYWALGFNASITKVREESLNAYPTATQVDVSVEVLDATTVRGTFTFTIAASSTADGQGGTRTECSTLVFATCEPFLELQAPASSPSSSLPPRPIFRFARSMAFLSGWGEDNYVYDKSDNTVMADARFTDIKLWDAAGTAYPWGWDLIEYAWSVQSSNIANINLVGAPAAGGTSVSSTVTDVLSIRQVVWYPLRCVTVINKCASEKQLASSVPQTDTTAPYAKRWKVQGWTKLLPNQSVKTCWDNNVAATEWHFYKNAYKMSGQATVSRCTDYSGSTFTLLELDNKSLPPAPKENYVNLLAMNKSSSTCGTALGPGTWSNKIFYKLPFTDGSAAGWTYTICGSGKPVTDASMIMSMAVAVTQTAAAAEAEATTSSEVNAAAAVAGSEWNTADEGVATSAAAEAAAAAAAAVSPSSDNAVPAAAP